MKSGSLYDPRCQGSYCCGRRVRPEVWLASSPSVTLRMSPPCCSSVTYLATGSSSATSPRFTACASKVARNALVTDARLNSTSEVIGSLRDVGHAVVEEQGAALKVDRDRHAAGGNEHRLHVLADDLLHLGVVGARGGGRGQHRGGGERCRRQCRRHHPHLSLPSGSRPRA